MILIHFLIATISLGCQPCKESDLPYLYQQTTKTGGPCEGCEAIYENPVPFENLNWMLWMPDFKQPGPKLAINGIVYKANGKTPAPGIILYVYHTDQTGHYPKRGDEKAWAKRHGYLRGWMKTNSKGEYKFFTLKPAPYPGRTEPAHIHIIIKEPGKTEYYIDDFVFEDDPLVNKTYRQKMNERSGNGIIKTSIADNFLKAERHIYLGKNIPNYK